MKNLRNSIAVLASVFMGAILAFSGSSTAFAKNAKSLKSAYAASASPMTVCSGFGCIIKDKFRFSASNNRKLAAIMARGRTSAKAERNAVATAISSMERMARGHLRHVRDTEFSYQRNRGHRGQMDCIDESLNTTSYLTYLHKRGWLRHHKPIRRYAARGLLLDGRYPHKSARMKDMQGVSWAVDSWKRKGGSKPHVLLLSKWYRERNSSSQY